MQLLNHNINSFNNYSNISFQMKKNEFKGIDRKVVEDTKAPVEKFDVKNDFYAYCNDLTYKIKDNYYGGKHEETKKQRQLILQEWFDYVLNENDGYTPSIAYMVLNGITKNLKENNDTLPPVLNKDVLTQSVEDAQNKIIKEHSFKFNFLKLYKENLQKKLLSAGNIPTQNLNLSKKQDTKNISNTVIKIKILSPNDWCTKDLNAESNLENEEFNVYMKNGKPKLGIRFENNTNLKTRESRNESIIPEKDSYTEFEDKKEKISQFIENNFPNGIENATTQEILESAGIKCNKDKHGLLTISHYAQPDDDFSYEDLGVDENKLLKDIKEIKGDADFIMSKATSLYNLKTIGGHVLFMDSQITDLGKLKTIRKDAYFEATKIKSLGNLQSIGGIAWFENSQVEDLGNLQYIGRLANFKNSQIKSLNKLKFIGEDAYFMQSRVTDLGNLQAIGRDAYIANSKLEPSSFDKIIIGRNLFTGFYD